MSFLEEIQDSGDLLESVSDKLNRLCDSCEELGLNELGAKLDTLADAVWHVKEKISKATHNKINEDFYQAQQSSANMINLAVAISGLKNE